MTVTYDDIVQSREQARKQGKNVSHVELTEGGIEDITGDVVAADDGEVEVSSGAVGTVTAFDVYEDDNNVLVTDDDTEIDL